MLVVIIRSIACLSWSTSFFPDKSKLFKRSRVYFNCLSSSCKFYCLLSSSLLALMRLASSAAFIWIGLSSSWIDLKLISMPVRKFDWIKFVVVFASWLCSEICDKCFPRLMGATDWDFFKLWLASFSFVIHEFGFCSSYLRIVTSGVSSTYLGSVCFTIEMPST